MDRVVTAHPAALVLGSGRHVVLAWYWHGVEFPLFRDLQSQLAEDASSSSSSSWKMIPTKGTSVHPGKGEAKWILLPLDEPHEQQLSTVLLGGLAQYSS